MRLTAIAILATLPALALAEEPWGQIDLGSAKALHEKSCVACHVRMYGGDGSKMYTRDGRLLNSRLDVLQRVASCNAQVSSGWFPEEEGAVAAWLNQNYYHFQK